MALISTSFKNGQIGNPNGRPVGSRNRRTKEIIDQIIKSNNKDPLITLSEISFLDPDSSIRAAAANMLAPYLHSKMQSTPAPRFVEETIAVPNFTSIDHAEHYLSEIPILLGKGALDSQTALELSTVIGNWIASRRAGQELELKQLAQGAETEQTIHITGGLPELPGTSVVMPLLNGHAPNGHALA